VTLLPDPLFAALGDVALLEVMEATEEEEEEAGMPVLVPAPVTPPSPAPPPAVV
jgi:hypothetical protein